MKQKILNAVGCLIAKWIIHNCEDGLVVKRKAGAEQIIKVFSVQAYRNIIKPRITAIEPKYLGENIAIGCRDGECKCGNIVRSYQNYCDECGSRLAWENVRG